jgi:hypothetical protein
MKIAGFEIKKQVKNYVQPPKEQKYGEFTIQATPVIIVPADVSNYKKAWFEARSQYIEQRATIYDLYQNALDFDAHLRSVIEKRLLATVGKKIVYMIGEKESEQANVVIQSPKFAQFIADLIMVKFWGMGLFQFATKKWRNQILFDYNLIPIKHVDPYEKMVRVLQYTSSTNDKTFLDLSDTLFVGEPECGGLLQQAALLALYKREMINGWTQYGQLAATNFKQIKYKGVTPDAKRRADFRETVQNAGKGVLDFNNNDFDLTESNQTSSSQNDLFEGFIKYFDEQLSILVLGQTMTTSDGSSLSQAQVHERSEETIFDADGKFVIDFLNYEFYEVQKMWNIPDGGKWSFVNNATSKQMTEVDLDLKIKGLGYIFSQEQIAEKYGLNVNTTIL